jgi:hypothetical protein
MKAWFRHARRAMRQWWLCRTERCDYYLHYLAWGPADMPHATWHHVIAEATTHFDTCTYNDHPRYRDGFTPDGKLDLCPICRSYEKRIRA